MGDADLAAAYSPSQPRAPKGSPGGGQFGSGSGGATPTNAAPVQQGQSGQTVKFLQERLNALGAKPPLAVDGKFGPLTLAAVKQYQAARGLKVDGLVGPLTTAALRSKIQKAVSGKTTPKTSTRKTGTSTARKTSTARPAAGKPATARPPAAKPSTARPSTAKTTTARPAARTPAAKPMSTKPGSVTPAQQRQIRQAVTSRDIPAGPAKAAMDPAAQKAMTETEAHALVAYLNTYPRRTGRHGKAAVVTRGAAMDDQDAPGGPLLAVPAAAAGDAGDVSVTLTGEIEAVGPGGWSHGWKREGGGDIRPAGKIRRGQHVTTHGGARTWRVEHNRAAPGDKSLRQLHLVNPDNPSEHAYPIAHPDRSAFTVVPKPAPGQAVRDAGPGVPSFRSPPAAPGRPEGPGGPGVPRIGPTPHRMPGRARPGEAFRDRGYDTERLSPMNENYPGWGKSDMRKRGEGLGPAPAGPAQGWNPPGHDDMGYVPAGKVRKGDYLLLNPDDTVHKVTGRTPARGGNPNYVSISVQRREDVGVRERTLPALHKDMNQLIVLRPGRRRVGARAAAGGFAAVGPHGFSHGWIKEGSAAHDDLHRGLNHDASQAIKDHLDKAWKAHKAGDHDKAEGHLIAAKNRAIYGGTAPRLQATIRSALGDVQQARQAERIKNRAAPSGPFGRHLSTGEADLLGHLGPAGGGRPTKGQRQAETARQRAGPFGRKLSKREARGFANLFGAAAGDDPGDGGVVPVPALVTIPGVDILAAGTWALSTGRQTFTREDLEQAVEAARCPAIGTPVIKIGHLDQRFAPGPGQDGEPAIGKVTNLRVNESGTKLLGDMAGMPGWLGAIASSAFPRRSVEGKYGFTCQIGHKHPFVLTALALLGVTPPGIGVLGGLDDIAALYGVTAASGGPGWHAEQTQEGTVMPVTEEDVRRAWYAAGGAPPSWWITELQMAPAQLIVADEASGQIYRVPFTIEGSAVQFGSAETIVSYADVAAARGTGPAVLYASAADSRAGVVSAASSWDGAAAVRNLGDDPSPAALKALFALPGSTKSDSSLPHHEVSSDGKVGAAHPGGVAAAIAAINGARGGLKGHGPDELKAAHGHLAGHLRDAGKEPPEFKADAAGDEEAARMDRLEEILARAGQAVAAAADADEDVKALVASLDATLDQASALGAGIDRSEVSADAGQALDLITAAEAIADQLMDALGIYDPDDADGDGSESATAASAGDGQEEGQGEDEEVEAASGDATEGGLHGTYDGEHTHPHRAGGEQGSDETHDHMHRHSGDGRHDHAHTNAAAPAAASQQEGAGDVEFTSDEMAAIRSRLGKKDGEQVTPAEIAAALAVPRAPVAAAAAGASGDPDVQVPVISDGTYLVDGEILRKYQERAVAGDQALHKLHLNERDQILASAVTDGKFSLARKPHFEALWDKDPEGTRKLVASLAPGLVPMGPPVGFAGEFGGDPDLPGDFEGQQAYRELYPEDYAREREQRRDRAGR